MHKLSKMIATTLFAGGLLISADVMAQNTAAFERALLESLTPSLRTEVETRMRQGGQKVHEVIDTILLNKIALAFATNRIVATDYVKGVVVVEASGGQIRVVAFDTQTLDIRPN
jgi:hypothetical protein